MKTPFFIYAGTALVTAFISLWASAAGPVNSYPSGAINWNGKYVAGDEKVLTISDYNVEKNTLHFKLQLITKDACSGELEGNATVQATGASYSGADKKNTCILDFRFDGKKSIEVKETTCDDFHGTSCPFDGIYEK